MPEKKYIVFSFQSVLYYFYLWFSFISYISSQSLRELQRDPDPEGTPFSYLMDGTLSFSITIILMALLMIIAVRMKLNARPFSTINIVFSCLALLFRFKPFIILFSLSGELVYWSYIIINEVVFVCLNILLALLSVYCLIKTRSSS